MTAMTRKKGSRSLGKQQLAAEQLEADHALQAVGAPERRVRRHQREDDRLGGECQEYEELGRQAQRREADEEADEGREHHPDEEPDQQRDVVLEEQVGDRVAADGTERSVRHADLARVAEEEVQRQGEDGEDEDLVDVADLQFHGAPLGRGRAEPASEIAEPDRPQGHVDEQDPEDHERGPPRRHEERALQLSTMPIPRPTSPTRMGWLPSPARKATTKA